MVPTVSAQSGASSMTRNAGRWRPVPPGSGGRLVPEHLKVTYRKVCNSPRGGGADKGRPLTATPLVDWSYDDPIQGGTRSMADDQISRGAAEIQALVTKTQRLAPMVEQVRNRVIAGRRLRFGSGPLQTDA